MFCCLSPSASHLEVFLLTQLLPTELILSAELGGLIIHAPFFFKKKNFASIEAILVVVVVFYWFNTQSQALGGDKIHAKLYALSNVIPTWRRKKKKKKKKKCLKQYAR